MLSKLIFRFKEKTSDHPLGSDANLAALIDEIPKADPVRQLLDVDHWFSGMEDHVAEIGVESALRALLRLDEFSRDGADELLSRYLSSDKREYLTDSVWSVLETHGAHVFACYAAALSALAAEAKLDVNKSRLALCAARALRAWTLRKKLQYFRYRRPAADLWRDAHELLQLLLRLNVHQIRVAPYRDEEETTPLSEYLVGLYLEFVPVGNLAPEQIEFAERFLRASRGLELSSQSHQLSTYRIDLAAPEGPHRIKEEESGGASVGYCAVARLRAGLMKLAVQVKKQEGIPDWVLTLPASRDQIEAGILALIRYWAPTRPKRAADRFNRENCIKAVVGFGLARRMIAASHFARMGRSLEYETNDFSRLFDEARFGRVHGDTAVDMAGDSPQPEIISPFDILNRLELPGDKAQMENWKQIDESAVGFGVIVPAVLSRHRIGTLICFRNEASLDWRMGLIRRIGRNAANRPSIGIEILASPSICAMAKPVGEGSVWRSVVNGEFDWLDAVIVGRDVNELILPAGTFIAGMEVDVRSEGELWRVRLESLLDHGSDYDRIKFSRIP